jgi:MSHA biogenesis protein MshE
VGSSLLGILAQRLLRRICDRCRESAPLDARQQNWLEAMVGPHARRLDFKRGAGCPRCNNTGYYGRVGVFELLRIDTPLADALRNDDSAGFIRIALNQRGFKPLPMAAFEYARQGITSMDEVLRLSGQIDEHDGIAAIAASLEPTEEKIYAAV